ncbi:extracellular solute-binding protein family 1 [Catenulispora acidiphila DSM 44928]|uniref:Extracellular solute-binding protein family 1 n=1 Tax=Catenulispora acidiphila (strain DSM 44928 / JCM 14897 / NBRC 102108 / NRRL B-24433 / ID139908) TaxID=479433 RepID=C7QHP5_CATAD|nr:extracellular solute-binding protein [Catenulispora acidiphila]ACU71070.1 extracellular solute-binding protein family 1 [Catenulispora acidiphila DSM 44928]
MGARSHRSVTVVIAVGLVSGLALAGCSSSSSKPSAGASTSSAAGTSAPSTSAASSSAAAAGPALPDLSGKSIQVLAEWSGQEQQDFQKVIDAFTAKTHAKVSYQGAGDQTPTVLRSKLAGGGAPDVALLAQPGAIAQFAKAGQIKPLGANVLSEIDANYDPSWKKLGTVNGQVYSIMFKAANKSTFWYNTAQFSQAGITPPKTWADFLKDCQALSDAGITPVSIGGADGWTLTDWFENVYLSQAGADNYDKLAHHQIPWTDPTVVQALTTMKQLFGNDQFMAGGKAGALQTSFNDSVTQTFKSPPKGAMVYEGDFSGSVITSTTSAKLGTDAKFFAFPAAGSLTNFVDGGGDAALATNDNPATMAFIQFLASPEAAEAWASAGGFVSPNKNVPMSSYPDDTTRAEAQMLVSAGDGFRFDMSDQAPVGFGGTKGAGEWKDLQDFLSNGDVNGTAAQLEKDAAKETWQ